MKKHSRLFSGFLSVCLFPILLFSALFLIFYVPTDIVRYRFSRYRKDMKRLYGERAKYEFLVTLSPCFGMYETVAKKSLPVRYFPRPDEATCSYGFFYCGKTLLIVDTVPSLDPETGKWCIVSKDDSDEPCCSEEYSNNEEDDSDEPYYAEEYAKNEAEEFQKCLLKIGKCAECNRAVFLIRERELGRDEKASAENADFILTYNGKNIADKLGSLCESGE